MTQERRADPQQTYALVVGVEDYAAGGDWNRLDGPVPDARRFADWLRGRGVPAQNIRLFLSPRASNQPLLTSNQPDATAATRQAIYAALMHDLNTKHGDLLYIFWSGHGMMKAKGQRRLFYADATPTSMLNLELDGLLTTLRSTTFDGFKRQICIVDACASYEYLEEGAFPHEGLAHGEMRPECEQFVLMGAKAGDYADNIGSEQTGIFAKTVLGLLTADQTSAWPPNMQRITRELQERFTILRNEGKTNQTPNYFSYQDWDGNIDDRGTLGNPTIPYNAPSPEASQHRTLAIKEKFLLRNALAECPSMRDNGQRGIVLSQLPSAIQGTISRNPAMLFDVFSIMDRCLDYEGGIAELVYIIENYELGSSQFKHLKAIVQQLGFAP